MSWKSFVAWVLIYAFLLFVAWISDDAGIASVVIFLVVTQIIEIRERAFFGPYYDDFHDTSE